MMTNELYVVALEQNLAGKEVKTWKQNAQKEELLESKCVKKGWEKGSIGDKMNSIWGKSSK
jgi:hypothetical protein